MLRRLVADIVKEALESLHASGRLASPLDLEPEVADPRAPEHGDFALNVAMVGAKAAGMAPRALAELLRGELEAREEFASVEVAGPGFLNVRLAPAFVAGQLGSVLEEGARLAERGRTAAPKRINVEFVSVNPNGPITIGSGRGAAFGSALCAVLEAAGHAVAREYYVNDAVGSEQMRIFAESVRALALGRPLPETAYRGDYVSAVAERLLERMRPAPADEALAVAGEQFDEAPPGSTERIFWEKFLAVWGRLRALGDDPRTALAKADVGDIQFALTGQMQRMQKESLAAFGVAFDLWFSEQSLHDSGAVARDIEDLVAKGLADEEAYRTKHKMGRGGKVEETIREEQPNDEEDVEGTGKTLWLRSTRLGDDMDRVLRRRDGRLTYIASDVAYHKDKFNRPPKADKLITILGPDHHGYIARLRAVVAAMLAKLGQDPAEALKETDERFEVVIYQLVRFLKDGKPAPMRKRDGNIYALLDLLKEIGAKIKPDAPEAEQLASGKDVARFFYLMRSHDSTFDFDLDLAERQSEENPVFYVQYAHARIHSVLAKAHEAGVGGIPYDPGELSHPREIALGMKILDLPHEVARAAEDYGVHRIATYAIELARAYHGFYDACRVIQPDQPSLSSARLDLCRAAAKALREALALIGVDAPERMERHIPVL